MTFLDPWRPQLLSVLRIMSAALVLQHGTTKHLNFPVGPMNDAAIGSMSGVAGLIELVGGALLLVGLFTRPVAFVLSGMTAAAYFIAHAPKGFFPILNGGELAALYCFVFLYIAAAGGGPWSLDRAIGGKSGTANV
ncbi:DoxX family protein [Roseovarius sp. CAU 1744]|uniref:DoxX family protein n=1 Tax=Roseovarius sp. CAU 1744 TaxID=3140368 RepID=UPI00325B3DFB